MYSSRGKIKQLRDNHRHDDESTSSSSSSSPPLRSVNREENTIYTKDDNNNNNNNKSAKISNSFVKKGTTTIGVENGNQTCKMKNLNIPYDYYTPKNIKSQTITQTRPKILLDLTQSINRRPRHQKEQEDEEIVDMGMMTTATTITASTETFNTINTVNTSTMKWIRKKPMFKKIIFTIAVVSVLLFILLSTVSLWYIPTFSNNRYFTDGPIRTLIQASSLHFTYPIPPPATLPRKSKYSDTALAMRDYVLKNVAYVTGIKRTASSYSPNNEDDYDDDNIPEGIIHLISRFVKTSKLIHLHVKLDHTPHKQKQYFGYTLQHFSSDFSNRGKGLAYVKTTTTTTTKNERFKSIIKIPFLDILYNLMDSKDKKKSINVLSQPTYACCSGENELICTKMNVLAHPNILNSTIISDETYTDDEIINQGNGRADTTYKLKCTLRFISETDVEEYTQNDINQTTLSQLDRTILFNNHVEMIPKYITSVYMRIEMIDFQRDVTCNIFVETDNYDSD